MSKLSLSQFSINSVTQELRSLQILWDDGHTSTYHYTWLRDNSPQCRDVHGQRCHDASAIPLDVHPWSVTILDDGGVEILWAQAEHRSHYSATWLRSHCYSTSFQTLASFKGTVIRTSRPELWTGRVVNKDMLAVTFDELMENSRRKRNWLEMLTDFGVAILRGVGTHPGDIEKAASVVGNIGETHGGRIFEIRSDHAGDKRRYPEQTHQVSTAMPYRDPVPALQSLHCLSSTGSIEECLFVDGYFVSGLLRRKYPGMFLLLSAFPVPFFWADAQHDFFSERPIIATNFRGEVTSIHFNHRASGPFRVPVSLMESYYNAYRTFAALLTDPDHQVRFTLEPGEVVVFDNLRVLQGGLDMRVLQNTQLQGCYVDST